MNASVFTFINREPFQTGFITGFAALGSAAVINIVSGFALGSATAPGVSGFLLAGAVSIVAGTIAGIRSKRSHDETEAQIEVTEAFAQGDYYACIRKGQQDGSRIVRALSAIAERQLQIDTNHARLMKDASTREDQLFAALDSVDDEICVYDKQSMLVLTNSAFSKRCNALGAEIAPGMLHLEVLGALAKSTGANMPVNEREAWFTVQSERRTEAMQSSNGVRFNRFHGAPARLFVIKNADGSRIEITRDLTAQQQLEEHAAKAQREADAAARIKSVTLARLSHTIRTPMTGVITAAELLINSNLDAVQKRRLDIIRRSAGTLLGVVQDMFDLAAGVTTDEAEEVVEVSAATEDAKLVTVAQRQALAYGFPTVLRQALTACVAKFSLELGWNETARTAVDTSKQFANTEHPVELILVPDQACRTELAGHFAALSASEPQMKLPNIFVTGSDEAGLLMLEQALQLLEANTAHIQTIAKHEAPATHSPNAGPAEILIVDQDEVNQIVYANGLAGSSVLYEIVSTGQAALDIIAKEIPRVILTDISMIELDGLELARRIRAKQGAKKVTIIGMTNHFLSGDRAKCLAAGMDDYIEKPKTAAQLLELIDGWLANQSSEMRKAG